MILIQNIYIFRSKNYLMIPIKNDMEPQTYKTIMILVWTIHSDAKQNWWWFWSKNTIRNYLIIKLQSKQSKTITYLCWFQYQQQQQKIEEEETWTTEEEIFLPRTLKIKFGEEYSRKCWRRNVFYLTHWK